jgi:hypothetical protein
MASGEPGKNVNEKFISKFAKNEGNSEILMADDSDDEKSSNSFA